MAVEKVLIPVWVLKTKIEADYEEYMFMCNRTDMEPWEDLQDEFPWYDSTREILEVLEANGVHFNKETGLWMD